MCVSKEYNTFFVFCLCNSEQRENSKAQNVSIQSKHTFIILTLKKKGNSLLNLLSVLYDFPVSYQVATFTEQKLDVHDVSGRKTTSRVVRQYRKLFVHFSSARVSWVLFWPPLVHTRRGGKCQQSYQDTATQTRAWENKHNLCLSWRQLLRWLLREVLFFFFFFTMLCVIRPKISHHWFFVCFGYLLNVPV